MQCLTQTTIDAMMRREQIVMWHQGKGEACPVYVEDYWFDGMGTMRATVFNLVSQTPQVVHASELGDVLTYDCLRAMQSTIRPGALAVLLNPDAVLLNPDKRIVYRIAVVEVIGTDIIVMYGDGVTEWIEDGLQYLIHVECYVSLEAIEARLHRAGQVA